jgi:hypothetical protein
MKPSVNPLTSGWRHYHTLTDYATASPFLAGLFARSHIIEFPFDIGSPRNTADQIRPSEPWLPRGAKKILKETAGQRFGQFSLDFTDTRPPYQNLVMLGASKGAADFIYVRSLTRGSNGFERELENFYEYHRDKLQVLVTLYLITRHKYEDGIPAVRALYQFGLSDESSWCFSSVLDDVANRAAQDEIAAFLANETDTISKTSEEIAEAIYARMLHVETQVCGFPRVPLADRRQAVVLRELDDHCAWWGDTAITFVAGMSLLNCKNIVEEQVAAPPLNRAARRRGEQPVVYRYHVLKVKPFSARADRAAKLLSDDTGNLQAIHWVRGHFKNYKPGRPLLGRYIGRIWFQPHLAGRDPERIVAKTYKIDSGRVSPDY